MTTDLPLAPPPPQYFRFPDEATGMAALGAAGLLTEDGEFITASHAHALDVIGDIPDLTGWHCNYVGELPNDWNQYVVTPQQPYRIFF